MNIKIRSERVSDYNSIADINYEAFMAWHPDNQYVSEPVLVDLLRHNFRFDPELSLVAEVDGLLVGHVLFSPYKFRVLGKEHYGVVLAPIAIKPEFQLLGIGKMLIEEGHRRAKEKGFVFSILCGHTEYYPRFGYKTKMFSLSGSKIVLQREHFDSANFSERPVSMKELTLLINLWESQHKDDSLVLFPGGSISEWCNCSPGCRNIVILKNREVVGYARYNPSTPVNIKELLAQPEDFQDVLAYLAFRNYGKPQGEIRAAIAEDILHKVLQPEKTHITDERYAHDAFMVKVLEEDSEIGRYCKQVEEGEIKPGIIIFPNAFDVDDGRVE